MDIKPTIITLDYFPRAPFNALHQSLGPPPRKRRAIIAAHRRAGKTVAAVNHLIKSAVEFPGAHGRFGYIAPTYRQAKDIAWLYVMDAYNSLSRLGARINESELRLDLPSDARVRLYGADNPDSLRGLYFDGVVIDESADVDPRLWTEILIPALSDRDGWALFIGTPKGQNAFFERLRIAQADPENWYWAIIRGSTSGILSPGQLAEMRKTMAPNEYNQEIECSFDEGAVNQFIDGDTILRARSRDEMGIGPFLIGADIARFGDDRTIFVVRRGRRLLETFRFWKLDTVNTAARLANTINKYAARGGEVHTFIDGVGIGGAVVDLLGSRNYQNISDVQAGARAIDFNRFLNVRAEMYYNMREWLSNTGDIHLGPDELFIDLGVTKYSHNYNGQLKLESKDDIKKRGMKSPDFADALALTFASPVAISESNRLEAPAPREVMVRDTLDDELFGANFR